MVVSSDMSKVAVRTSDQHQHTLTHRHKCAQVVSLPRHNSNKTFQDLLSAPGQVNTHRNRTPETIHHRSQPTPFTHEILKKSPFRIRLEPMPSFGGVHGKTPVMAQSNITSTGDSVLSEAHKSHSGGHGVLVSHGGEQ